MARTANWAIYLNGQWRVVLKGKLQPETYPTAEAAEQAWKHARTA